MHAIERAASEKKPQLGESFCPRETEVTKLVAKGLRNRGIAAVLGVTERTVKFWISRALAKSGTTNRIELSRWFKGESSASVSVMPRRDAPYPSARGSLPSIEHELRNISAALRIAFSPIETVRQALSQLLERAAQLGRDVELEQSDYLQRVAKLEEERTRVRSALRTRVAELARSMGHLEKLSG